MKKYFFAVFLSYSVYFANAQKTILTHSFLLPGHNDDVTIATFSPKNNFLVSAGIDKKICVYNSESPFELIKTISVHQSPINVLKFNRSGNMMASGSNDFSVLVFDSVFNIHRKLIDANGGHTGSISAITFDPTSNYLFSGGKDGKICMWEINSSKRFKTINLGTPVNSIAMSSDPRILFVAGSSTQIKVISLPNGQVKKEFSGHTDVVNSIQISSDNKYLLSGSNDKSARLWDLKTGKAIRKFPVDCWKVTAVSFSRDNKYCITACNDGSVKVWELASGNLLSKVDAQFYNIGDVSISKNLEHIAIAPMLRNTNDFGVRIFESGLEKANPINGDVNTKSEAENTIKTSDSSATKLNSIPIKKVKNK